MVGRTHVYRLLTVPIGERKRMQRTAISEGWSVSRLQAEIAERFGVRGQGGRTKRLPKGVPGVLAQMEGARESWQRLVDALRSKPTADRGVVWTVLLPKSIKEQTLAAVTAVVRLHATVSKELRVLRPGRIDRARLQNG